MEKIKKHLFDISKIFVALMFFVISVSGIIFALPLSLNSSSSVGASSESVSITNSDFTSTSGSSKPATVSNWTKSVATTGVISGVIDAAATDTVITDDYKLSVNILNPRKHDNAPDDKMLLINNTSKTVPQTIGYESSEITLDANNYYEISVWARQIDDARGTIYVKETNADAEVQLNKAVPLRNNGWAQYSIFIKTHSLLSSKVKIGLFLGEVGGSGGYGAVMFDTVRCFKITSADYIAGTTNMPNSNGDFADLTNYNNVVTDFLGGSNNQTFEAAITGWAVDPTSDENVTGERYSLRSGIGSHSAPGSHNNLGSGSTVTNEYGLLIYSLEGGYKKLKSSEFTILQHGSYRVSYWAKMTSGVTATASIKTTNFKKNDKTVNVNNQSFNTDQTISATTNAITNNWGFYSIVISGNALYDVDVIIELSFGSLETDSAGGYVIFDDFKLEKLNSNDAIAAKALSNTNTLTLNSFTVDSGTVSNGYFNFADQVNFTDDYSKVSYPLQGVTSFTKTAGNEESTISGIIDANYNHFNANKEYYGPADLSERPAAPLGYFDTDSITLACNVLMLHNVTATWQNYESKSISLSSGSFYKISVDAARTRPDAATNAFVIIKSGDVVLATLPVTDASWQVKEFYIKTASTNLNITINLALGTNKTGGEAQGFAYFNNAKFETITESQYDDAYELGNISKTDLSFENFKDIGEKLEGHSNIYKTNRFTLSGNGAVLGVIRPSDNDFASLVGNSSYENSNILMLRNIIPTVSKATSTLNYTLNGDGEYYKVSASIKLMHIECEDEEAEDGGATIKLTNFDESFTGIKTTTAFGNDAYIIYEFYIKTTDSRTFSFEFSLGSEENKVAGYLLCDNLSILKIDKETFEQAEEDKFGSSSAIFIASTDAPEEENEEEENKNKFTFNWFYFSSVVLVLTLFIAIIAVAVRRINFSKFKRKNKMTAAEYDKYEIERQAKKAKRREKWNKFIDDTANFFKKIGSKIKSLFNKKDKQ